MVKLGNGGTPAEWLDTVPSIAFKVSVKPAYRMVGAPGVVTWYALSKSRSMLGTSLRISIARYICAKVMS